MLSSKWTGARRLCQDNACPRRRENTLISTSTPADQHLVHQLLHSDKTTASSPKWSIFLPGVCATIERHGDLSRCLPSLLARHHQHVRRAELQFAAKTMADSAGESSPLLAKGDSNTESTKASRRHGDANGLLDRYISENEQRLSQAYVGERLPYGDYSSIDFLHDLVRRSSALRVP